MRRFLVAVVIGLVGALPSQASLVVASYTSAGASTLAADPGGPVGVVSSAMTGGPGIASTGSFTDFRFSGFGTSTGLADAFAAGDFWTWNLEVSSGYELDLASVGFALQRPNGGPIGYGVEASINGATPQAIASGSLSGSTPFFPTFSLTPLPTLLAGDDVTFRLAAWGPGGSDVLSLRNVSGFDGAALQVTGSVLAAIPEPTTAFTGGLLVGALALTVGRRQ